MRFGSIILDMVIDMNETRLNTVAQLRAFLEGTLEVKFQPIRAHWTKTRGYADRAQAHLLRDMTAMCHRCNPNIALLTADLLGYPALEQQAFPYSLFADGIYQDSHGHPQTWSAVRFPAWRNVAWGCNWAPITNLELISYGVLAHDATIAWGNGCFGDDTGLAEINEVTRKKLLSLWQSRMRQARSRTLPIARQV